MFVAVCAMFGLNSCLIEGAGTPSRDITQESSSKVIFLKSSSCAYSAAAERYFRQAFESWRETYNLPEGATLEQYVKFVELDEGAAGFNMNDAKDYLKSAKYYYDLGDDVATPVICFGSRHISSWDYTCESRVNDWIRPYLEKTKGEWKASN